MCYVEKIISHMQTNLTVRVRLRDVVKFTHSVIPYIYHRPSDIMRWKIGNYAEIQGSLCGKLGDFLILILWYYTWSKGKKTPLYALTKILSAIINTGHPSSSFVMMASNERGIL